MSALADPTTTSGGGCVGFPVVRFGDSAVELTIKDGNGFDLFLREGMMKLEVERFVVDLRLVVDWRWLVVVGDGGGHGVDGEIDVIGVLFSRVVIGSMKVNNKWP